MYNLFLIILISSLLSKFLQSAAQEPKEVTAVKKWMKENRFSLLADINGGEIVAR